MGDVQNNVARSLSLGAVKLGMDMRLCGPRELWPDKSFSSKLLDIASATNAKVHVCDNAAEGLRGADFVYTDVWLAMGEPKEKWAERIRMLEPYRVTSRRSAQDEQSSRQVHALLAGLPQHRDEGRR